MYSPNDATNRCGSGGGGGEGGRERGGGFSVNTRQKNDTKFFVVSFWCLLSPDFAVKGSLLLGGQVGTAWI